MCMKLCNHFFRFENRISFKCLAICASKGNPNDFYWIGEYGVWCNRVIDFAALNTFILFNFHYSDHDDLQQLYCTM